MTKKTRGVTLVELLVSISILAIVAAAAGSAFVAAFQTYAVIKKLQDDQYNARLALLSIAREVHRGVKPNLCTFEDGKLVLSMVDGSGTITYQLTSGKLIRTGVTDNTFSAVDLTKFTPKMEKQTIILLDSENVSTGVSVERYQLTIDIEAQNDLKLSTTLSLSRIPVAAPSGS